MVRHQAAGIITSHVFQRLPSAEQVAALTREVERLHGDATWWVRLHEAELIDSDDELPTHVEAAHDHGARKTGALAPEFVISGIGHVTQA